MRSDVAAALSRSSTAFMERVWPVIGEACGGGELVPVEAVTAEPFARELDVLAGVDAWQVIRPHGMRPLASRVQWCTRPYNTFTIRASLPSGYATELQKRWRAIQHGYLYPAVTVQAYLTDDGTVLSAAIAHTRELFTAASAWVTAHGTDDELWRRRDGMWIKEAPDGNRFLVVDWATYRAAGLWLWAYEAAPATWMAT